MPKPNSKKVEKAEKEAYLEEARGWERDRQYRESKSTRLAWRLAGVSWVITVIAVTGLAAMGPMKTVVPFVIQTDKTTGVVDVVNTLTDQKNTESEAMNKFFVQRYVRYREAYTNALAADTYSKVGLMSAPAEQLRYFAWFNPKNPMSPLNVYKDFATVKVTMKSTSFIKPDVALVRYIKEVERGGDKSVSNWAATVTFSYVKAPMNEKDREVNPLGFQVVEYRNDPEGASFEVPAPLPAAPQAPAKPAVSIFPPSPQADAAGSNQ